MRPEGVRALVDAYARRLAAWLAEAKVDAEHRTFDVSTHSVAEAAAAVDASAEDFVKSICMLAEDGRFVVAIVKGEDRASTAHVAEVLGAVVRLARPDEMLARTGYPAGGTPPFGFEAIFLVDERVMERARVWGGGGSDRALVHVAPGEMLRANRGRVARVRT